MDVTVISIVYFCQQFERHPKWDWNKISFDGFNCWIGLPCPYRPKTTANRIVYSGCILGSIIYGCLLSSVIMQLVLTPILSPQTKSVQEIIDGDFKLIGERFVFEKLMQPMQVIMSKILKIYN